MYSKLLEQVENLQKELDLRATGADIHEFRGHRAMLSAWVTFMRKRPERAEEYKEKLIVSMEKARKALYK